MESKHVDENKSHDLYNNEISAPNERYSRETSSSSSSVCSSEFEDPLRTDNFDTGNVVRKGEQNDQMIQQQGGENSLQSPPIQTMERPPNSSSGYRFPSSVFARNKSGTPADWSINSNESLFSIRMGANSFTQDQFNWITKVELDPEGDKNSDQHQPNSEDLPASGDQISSVEPAESSLESRQPEKSTDISSTENVSTSIEPATDKAEEPEHRKEEPEINSDHHHHNNPNSKSSHHDEHSRNSHCSDASGQSFAFPLLVEEGEKGGSVKSGHTPQGKLQEQETKPPQKSSPSNINQVQAGTPEPAPSSSWFTRCFSLCSCHS